MRLGYERMYEEAVDVYIKKEWGRRAYHMRKIQRKNQSE